MLASSSESDNQLMQNVWAALKWKIETDSIEMDDQLMRQSKFQPKKAFKDHWLNKEHSLHITKVDLVELLNIATKSQLFQFEGNLYEQVDGVAMGLPLVPLMVNTFMCSIEE